MIKKKPSAFKSLMLFTANRYFVNVLQMVRGLIIAKYLGPYYFGVWGFLTIALQYLSYSNLNVENGVTVLLSVGNKKEERDVSDVSSTAIMSSVVVGLLLLFAGGILKIGNVELFPKFEFNSYIIFILLITFLSNIQRVLTNIQRVKKALNKIAIVETTTNLLLLGSAFIFKEERLIIAQLSCMLLTNVLAIIIYSFGHPFSIHWRIKLPSLKKLFDISFPLFIYNVSFYLITLSARTVLSAFYSVAQLGYYTLAYSISNAILLGFRSIAWAIYPEVLAKLQHGIDISEVKANIDKINRIYSTAVNFALYALILLLPLLLEFVPQYKSAFPTIVILLLAQGFLTISFGFNSLAVSRNEQGKVAKISVLIVAIVTAASLGVSWLKMDYIYIAIAVLVGSLVYTILQTRLGLQILEIKENLFAEYQKLLPVGSMLAFAAFFISAFSAKPYLWGIMGFVIFIIFSLKQIKELYFFVTRRRSGSQEKSA